MIRFAVRLATLLSVVAGAVLLWAAAPSPIAGPAVAAPLAANAGWDELGPGSASGGGISANGGDSFLPSLAIGPDGAPVVAWYDKSGGDLDIYVRRWNGSVWVELGGSASGGGVSNNNGDSTHPSLAIDGDGRPVVAWHDNSDGDRDIYLRRWNGTTWEELGGSASNGGISDNWAASGYPSLVIDGNDRPIVAWHDDSGGARNIYLRRWNGTTWEELGGSASDGGISGSLAASNDPSLVLGPDGAPIVAWQEDSGFLNLDVYLRRWNGTSWEELGGSASDGGISDNNGSSGFVSLAIDGDGRPVVAWRDDSGGDFEIYLRRWNGDDWVELDGSASGGGISANGGDSRSPSLATLPGGAPIVSWRDDDSGDFEIYVRRWTGSAWVEMDAGSATGGGISANGGESWWPSLAVGPDGPVVAWEDDSGGDDEIYVRRYVPGSPTATPTATRTPTLTPSSTPTQGPTATPTTTPTPGPTETKKPTKTPKPTATTKPTRTPTPTKTPRVTATSGPTATATLAMPTATATTLAPTATATRRAVTQSAFLPSVLYVPLTCFAGPGEAEPNNNSADADGPLCAGRDYNGLPNDRFDVFWLEAAAGSITVDLTNHIGVGIQLQLHYQQITGNPIGFDPDGSNGYRIALSNAPAGRYYIIIFSRTEDPSATARYGLRAVFGR